MPATPPTYVGKWHMGGDRGQDPALKKLLPQHQGFEHAVSVSHGAPISYYFPYGRHGDGEGDRRWKTFLSEDERRGLYLTDRVGEEARRVIRHAKDRPFFLYLSFYAVHTPIEGRPDLVAKYERLPKGQRHRNASYAAMVEAMDTAVGKVRSELETAGIADRTLVIFTSDNGGYARGVTTNAPLRGEKGQQWEGGERVPAIVYWPGVTKPGSVCLEPTISMDYYPTFLEIAGAAGDPSHNRQLDGTSLVPLLRNADSRLEREALYWHYPHYNGFFTTPYGTVRTRDYKLVEYYEDGQVGLYNLEQDVGEQFDLSREKPEVVRELRRKLQAFLLRTNSQMPLPNPAYNPDDPVAKTFYSRFHENMNPAQ